MYLTFYLLGSFPPEVVAAVRSQGGLLPSPHETPIKPGVWPIIFRYFIGFKKYFIECTTFFFFLFKLTCNSFPRFLLFQYSLFSVPGKTGELHHIEGPLYLLYSYEAIPELSL